MTVGDFRIVWVDVDANQLPARRPWMIGRTLGAVAGEVGAGGHSITVRLAHSVNSWIGSNQSFPRRLYGGGFGPRNRS